MTWTSASEPPACGDGERQPLECGQWQRDARQASWKESRRMVACGASVWRCPQRPSLGDRRDVWRNKMVNSLYLLTYPAECNIDETELMKGNGYCMTEEKSKVEIPQALEPPIVLGGDNHQFEAWKGSTTFRREGKELRGEARVFLDLMPVPEFRFEFTPETKPTLRGGFAHAYRQFGVQPFPLPFVNEVPMGWAVGPLAAKRCSNRHQFQSRSYEDDEKWWRHLLVPQFDGGLLQRTGSCDCHGI